MSSSNRSDLLAQLINPDQDQVEFPIVRPLNSEPSSVVIGAHILSDDLMAHFMEFLTPSELVFSSQVNRNFRDVGTLVATQYKAKIKSLLAKFGNFNNRIDVIKGMELVPDDFPVLKELNSWFMGIFQELDSINEISSKIRAEITQNEAKTAAINEQLKIVITQGVEHLTMPELIEAAQGSAPTLFLHLLEKNLKIFSQRAVFVIQMLQEHLNNFEYAKHLYRTYLVAKELNSFQFRLNNKILEINLNKLDSHSNIWNKWHTLNENPNQSMLTYTTILCTGACLVTVTGGACAYLSGWCSMPFIYVWSSLVGTELALPAGLTAGDKIRQCYTRLKTSEMNAYLFWLLSEISIAEKYTTNLSGHMFHNLFKSSNEKYSLGSPHPTFFIICLHPLMQVI